MGTPRSYVICTAPRSGSTLLCHLLRATGVAGWPGSHFHRPSLTGWLDAYGLREADFANREEAARRTTRDPYRPMEV
ncbi:MAG: Stf0 family sulfotransferase [Pseudomonadota bacterium]